MMINDVIYIGILFFIVNVLSDNSYKIYNIESGEVCSLYKHLVKRINAGFNGIIVREASYFDTLSGKHNFKCTFEVETGSENQFPGLFVVIQNMRMRQDPKTGECIDYVKLRKVVKKDPISENLNINLNIKKNTIPGEQFCGDLRANRDGYLPSRLSQDLAVTGYVSDYYAVEVEIFVSKLPIQNTTLELEMLFTPYLNCKNMWSEYRECGMEKCIKKQNFKDGWVNCPFLNCPDEGGCANADMGGGRRPAELQKLTLTAVTSIFCSFFLFLLLIWCCRYFELLCWGANTLLGRSNPVELSPMNCRAPSPSAPPPDTSAKDLPPAYETLFPDSVPRGLILRMLRNSPQRFAHSVMGVFRRSDYAKRLLGGAHFRGVKSRGAMLWWLTCLFTPALHSVKVCATE